eukprot:gene27065-2298_t
MSYWLSFRPLLQGVPQGLPLLANRLQATFPSVLDPTPEVTCHGTGPNATQSRGFLSWMPEELRKQRITTPLTHPLDSVPVIPPYKASSTPPPTEITVLDNGVRIVSEASPGATASFGLYVNSGSIYEDMSSSGSSAVLECLAFKSSTHRNSSTVMKEVEKIGSNIMANASREQMSYTIDCLKSSLPAALEILCDVVLNPKFDPVEVEEQKMRLSALLANKDVQLTLLNELLVRSVYTGALGKPLIPNMESLPDLSSDVLRNFVTRNYVGPRMVLAAAGVAHKDLVELAEPMLKQIHNADVAPEPSSTYQGGFVHLPGSLPQPNLILAFEFKGGWRDVEGAVAMTVLTYLLGGGNSFSSGGPGKGMHSRLYTRVLNQYGWVHSCTAFNSTFNDTGLVGIQASCDPNRVHDMLHVMCHEMEAVARSVNAVELERAKRAATSIIYNALESKATSAEDIGRQFLTYGHRISGSQYIEMIEAITVADIYSFVGKLLESRPSLAAFGDGTDVIDFNTVLASFVGKLLPSRSSLTAFGDGTEVTVFNTVFAR